MCVSNFFAECIIRKTQHQTQSLHIHTMLPDRQFPHTKTQKTDVNHTKHQAGTFKKLQSPRLLHGGEPTDRQANPTHAVCLHYQRKESLQRA